MTLSERNFLLALSKRLYSRFYYGGTALVVIVLGAIIFTNHGSATDTIVWTERQPASDSDNAWSAVASDSTGTNLVAGVYNGRLYTSANSGSSWTERRPIGDANKTWYSVASDADGSHLIAAVLAGRVYVSANSGADWTDAGPGGAGVKVWSAVASDSDGSHLIASVNGGRIYISENYGSSWTETRPLGDNSRSWRAVASDADGSNLLVVSQLGDCYVSVNFGSNWSGCGNTGEFGLISAASDSDGSNLIVGSTTGRLYTSSDGGLNWTERQPAGDTDNTWSSVASDSDGSNLAAVVNGGRVYTSSNSGVTWTERQPAGDANKNWSAIASDADGSNLLAGVNSGRLYTGVVTNTAPAFSAGPSDGGSSSAAPTNVGSNVSFSATATDAESDSYYLAICKTDSVTANNSAAPTCGGGNWCVSGVTTTGTEASCNRTTQSGDTETNAWYAFVCDYSANSQCSASAQGSGVTGSPFIVYTAPASSSDSSSSSSSGSENAVPKEVAFNAGTFNKTTKTRTITLTQSSSLRLNAKASDPDQVKKMTLRVNQKNYSLKKEKKNGKITFYIVLSQLSGRIGKFPYSLTANYGSTDAREKGVINMIVKQPLLVLGDLNANFKTVYGRKPTAKEVKRWSGVISSGVTQAQFIARLKAGK